MHKSRFLYLVMAIVFFTGSGACENNREAAEPEPTSDKTPTDQETEPKEVEPDVGEPAQGASRGKPKLKPGTEKQKRLLAKAKKSFLADNFAAAEPVFKRVTETGPLTGTQMSAYIALGQIYLGNGEPIKAIDLLELVPSPGKRVVELRLVLARAYADDGQYREAIDEYEKLLELQPNYLFAYPPLGAIYVKQGEKKKAAKLYRRYENRLTTMAAAVEQPEESKAIERLNILDIFASSNDQRVVKAVEAALDDPNARVRAKAAKTAAMIKAVTARSRLEKMAREDPSKYVRRQAERAANKLEDVERPPDRDGAKERFAN